MKKTLTASTLLAIALITTLGCMAFVAADASVSPEKGIVVGTAIGRQH